jgi:hypothetical protein
MVRWMRITGTRQELFAPQIRNVLQNLRPPREGMGGSSQGMAKGDVNTN